MIYVRYIQSVTYENCNFLLKTFLLELGKLNFTDAFKLAITELPEEYDPTSLGAYTTFVGEFGTHYAKRSTMGARYGIFYCDFFYILF